MKKNIWNVMRNASEKGWDGTITCNIEYDAPGVHAFGEHVFNAGGEGYGDYYYPEEDLPVSDYLVKKAIKENYCFKDTLNGGKLDI